MAATTSTTVQTFTPNERVLCYHGPLIYEAKTLRAENWDEQRTTTGVTGWHYFVHYKGWKQTWDEWVPSSRLLKYNETNVAIQKQLHSAGAASTSTATTGHKASHATGASKASTSRATAGRKDGTRGTKRGRDDEDPGKKPDMKLEVPEALKAILVDDWELVTKDHQLVTLNRSPTAAEILREFQEYVLREKPANLRDPELIVPAVVAGLLVYFDRSLGTNLLYRSERPQYAEIRKKYITGQNVAPGSVVEMSSVYGAEHLLRMLVSLPQMVANSNMDFESVCHVRDYVNELMVYMLKERDRLFLTAYETASSSYQNTART